mmetsp:Transcript_87/g.159  ORF Transcript_87/g.159 Transcript_87/m.159 type:complete len:103 (-) Transcript_87:1545-1853(-)
MCNATDNKSSLKCCSIHTERRTNLILVVEHVAQDAIVDAPLNTFGIKLSPESASDLPWDGNCQIQIILVEEGNHEIFSPHNPLSDYKLVLDILPMYGNPVFS